MPDINQIYQSQFLRAEQLGGRPRTVTITAAPAEVVGQGEKAQQKIVLSFQGVKPRFPLNKVNVMTCAGFFGPLSEHWVGKQIELRPEKVLFQGQLVPAIRIYPAAIPPPAAPVLATPAPAPAAPAAPAAAGPPADAGDAWEPEQQAADEDVFPDDLPWKA